MRSITEAQIALRERINELRAKQRWHSLKEEALAMEIQAHIRKQSRIEDYIMELEVEFAQQGEKVKS